MLPALSTVAPDAVRALSLDMLIDYMGVRLDGERAQGKAIVRNRQCTDTQPHQVLNLENSALSYQADAQAPQADTTVTLVRATLDEISLQKTTFPAALQAGLIAVNGNRGKLVELLGLLDAPGGMFAVVEPRP